MGQVSAQEAIALLDRLIATPSHSREESGTGDVIEAFLRAQGVDVQRIYNNVWARCVAFDSNKPTLLLNSHHDTNPLTLQFGQHCTHTLLAHHLLFGR